MRDEGYRKECFSFLTALGAGYWIEIAGERKTIEAFQNEEMLWEFTNTDDWNYTFLIGRSYLPADNEISSEQISTTIMKEFDKLILLYRHMYS